MDRATSSIILTRSDGKEASFPMARSPFQATSTLASLHVLLKVEELVAVTQGGDVIVFELAKPEGGGGPTIPVVYLDQNQWSTVANARYGMGKVSDEERTAALQLVQWAMRRLITVPASSGHYYETTKRFSAHKRHRLGLTVLQLSRGWQMRDPLQVRRDELFTAFCSRAGYHRSIRDTAVFTLTPNAIHATRSLPPNLVPPDFSAAMALRHEAVTAASALIDSMLDTERIETEPDMRWATVNQEFSDWLDDQPLDSQQKRKAVDGMLLMDFQREITEEATRAGLAQEDLWQWISHDAQRDLSRLPAIGLFRESLYDRHINRATRWKPNDLVDMVYLSCAAGYADVVVCERQMGSLLSQGVRRLNRPTKVFRRLSDAVAAIASMVVQVEAGRLAGRSASTDGCDSAGSA